ncbi:MAG: SdpA family antimicrobial peptide system protein [Bacteroidota bacterium]
MKNTIVFCFCSVLWGGLLLLLLKASLPYNPIDIPTKLKMNLNALMPEGWAFFTRNPREASIFLYAEQEESGRFDTYCTYPSASPTHWMGTKRTLRSIGAEVGALITQVPDSVWVAGEGRIVPFLTEHHTEFPHADLPNPVSGPYVCGEVYLVKKTPTPWAWARHDHKLDHQFKIAKIEVSCL